MSTETSADVSLIRDEDLLRRMWQDTADFGRKKEIRAHMYKLREARLRDFYNSGEVSSDIQKTSKTSTTSSSKMHHESSSKISSTHADNLADHSFISMKTKEIRDSESPTRDVSYNRVLVSDNKSGHNQNWNIQSKNETSADGKTFTTSKVATTSGAEKLDNGALAYAAKTEQKTSVYQDGDEKNFTKGVGSSSNSMVHQEASGGDQNSSFKSSTTKTSSSARYVSESKSSSGDSQTHMKTIAPSSSSNQETLISRNVYTDNIPEELKTHPSYVDGKTKVTRETKTLADGTTVTTTRYEIRGGSSQTKSSNQVSSSEKRSSSTKTSSSTSKNDQNRTIKYSQDVQPSHTSTTTVTRTVHDEELIPAQKITKTQTGGSTTTSKTTVIRGSTNENVQDSQIKIIKSSNEPQYITTSVKTTKTVEEVVPQQTQDKNTTVKTTLIKNVQDFRDVSHQNNADIQKFITVEQEDTRQRAPAAQPPSSAPKVASPERQVRPQQEPYQQPERRQPIKPGKGELDQKLPATEGQYDTTYRAEFTNKKRISQDLSATHQAFASSLRSVSPDRLRGNRTPSRGSLRSSQSPEKMRHPTRFSPDRRSTSPKKTLSSETITLKRNSGDFTTYKRTNEADSNTLTRRRTKTRTRSPSPTTTASEIEFYANKDIVTDLDTNETTFVTKSRPGSLEISRKSPKKVTDRSPTSPLIPSARESPRRSSLRNVSPTKDTQRNGLPRSTSPRKDVREDRPLKRTDTYEERCRQILGLTGEGQERRRSSLDRLTTRRGSGSKAVPSVTTPEKKSPTKEIGSPIRKSPEKKIQEFPSQIRKSPEKRTVEAYPEKRKSTSRPSSITEFPSQIRKSPEKEPLEPYPEKKKNKSDGPTIGEFPSQIRKSPKKEPLGPYPEKKSPKSDAPTICEFPSQIRKTPERKPLGPYPEKKKPKSDGPTICEFPSQIRKTPEKEPLQAYPEKKKPTSNAPTICEFPSQTRKSPEREPLGPYPEKTKPKSVGPTISEFPSQIRKSPEREVLEPYPEKQRIPSVAPTISEFPAQTRKSPERQTKPSLDINEMLVCEVTPSEPLQPVSTKKTPKKLTETSSSSEDEEDKVNELLLTKTTSQVDHAIKEKVPVNEPLFTKRFISKLGEDEENQRTDIENNSVGTLESEIIETVPTASHKTVKKDLTKKTNKTFIETAKVNTETSNKSTTLIKKQTQQPEKKKITVTTTVTTTKTTKKIPEDKPKMKETKKITLYDVDDLSGEDKSIHIRTHRIDETINKKNTKCLTNGDVKKTTTVKKQEPKKAPVATKPIEKKPSKTLINNKNASDSLEIKKISQTTPKRHVVTITVSPKSKPTQKSPSKKTKVNGHATSDTEEDEVLEQTTTTTTTTRNKITRTTSDQVIKKKPEGRYPVRGASKPELLSNKQTDKTDKKCISTKTIDITNEKANREIVVDLMRSTSSREPSPNKICPVTSDDEESPRYPDEVEEPDDRSSKKSTTKLSEIIEGATSEFTRITDVTDVDRVDETDESLLSVDKKISKFLNTSEKVSKPVNKGPAPKVDRPKLDVDETLKSDECLLSVSEKVNKFITTAEQLTTPQDASLRPKSPKCQYYPEEDVNVSSKVEHFITTAKNVTKEKSPTKFQRDELQITDQIKDDQCLLSVSDKVNKFKSTVEQLSTDKTSVSLSKLDERKRKSPERRQPSPENKQPIKEMSPVRKPGTQFTPFEARKSPEKEIRTPKSGPAPTYHSSKSDAQREPSPKRPDSTPKSSRRVSDDDIKSPVSTTTRLRSTESIKKAKALFENNNDDQKILKQRDILSRPSVFEGRKMQKSEIVRKLDYEEKSRKSPEKITVTRPETPDSDMPGYMKPLDRSLRPHSPHRESINQINKKCAVTSDEEERSQRRETKFGVTLRRTDSGRVIGVTNFLSSPKKVVDNITEEEIEEIYSLEILEELLIRVVSYELRRVIRTQIRLVKKLISEGKLQDVINKTSAKTTQKSTTEYRSSFTKRKTSTDYSTATITRSSSKSPERKSILKERSPDKQIFKDSTFEKFVPKEKSPEPRSILKTTTADKYSPKEKSPERRKSPEKTTTKTTTTTKVFSTQLKKTTPNQKSAPVQDNVPEWVKQRNLKKASDVSSNKSTKTSTSTVTTSTVKKSRSSPVKEIKTDSITSSYGVGPTDENGSPLFGLKALRASNKTESTKVQGTVIRSQYYSENGNEPVGEISVTKYSTDPRDLGPATSESTKGLTSVTTTQKFGYKDTPSLKTLTSSRNSKKEICNEEVSSSSTTKKFNRKGSVKEISQKFIDNAVETVKNERQSSYPKAGLILRTSSFKDTAASSDETTSRENSTERTITSTTSSSGSFLTNKSKVSGMQDIISRMKAEDVRTEEISSDDAEARSLLNKFIGSQVILSGMQQQQSVKSSSTTSGGKTTTKITTTVTEGGRPKTITRTFQHPISEEELSTIWEEQTLRLLLEQSNDYEERRRIRARLRQVMAEQEACTELVEKASQDISSATSTQQFEGTSETKGSFTQGPVTTTQTQVTTRVTSQQQISKKPISPFAKFRQLDKQNSLNTPPSTPKTPSGSGPLFKFTDPALSQSASTIKDRLLHWCRMKTKEYENIQLDNFSTSWADGLAFCALIHHFLPDAFDYHALTPKNRRHNFTLAFQVADEKADIAPLLDVDDMVATRKPDWKCVFTYVQSIYRRFKDED